MKGNSKEAKKERAALAMGLLGGLLGVDIGGGVVDEEIEDDEFVVGDKRVDPDQCKHLSIDLDRSPECQASKSTCKSCGHVAWGDLCDDARCQKAGRCPWI